MEYRILSFTFAKMTNSVQLKYYRNIGTKLLKARLAVSLEQKEVARQIGKTQSYISKVESGDIKIDLFTLIQLSKLYKKSPKDFLVK